MDSLVRPGTWLAVARRAALAAVFSAVWDVAHAEAIGPAHPVVAGFERFYANASTGAQQTEGGMLLLTELNCVNCHATPAGWAERLPNRAKLSLATVGSRLDPAALAAFIQAPASRKPGTTMPGLVAAGTAGDTEVEALVAFLASQRSAEPVLPAVPGDVDAGRALYQSIGCVACHAPVPAAPGSQGTTTPPGSVPIALASDYKVAALTQFLLDPLANRPAGRMPSSHLSPGEAAHLAAFLQASQSQPHHPRSSRPGASSDLAVTGRKRFAELGCVACHDTGQATAAAPATRTLATLDPDAAAGCLAPTPGPGTPNFHLSDPQRLALRNAITEIQKTPSPVPLTPRETVAATMLRLNCYACHTREGRGGVEKNRLAYFHSNDSAAESLGELGTLPPSLEHTGRKLQREWLEKLLWGPGGSVRPYLETRMPSFGQANMEPMLEPWAKADTLATPVAMDTSGQLAHQRSPYGRILMGTSDGGLGCITCHGLKDRKSIGVPVINLTQTVQRLQPAYFKELLLDPQGVQPGTLMPPMFMGRPKADQEVEQIWTYLKEIQQQRLPDGLLVTGEYELKPETNGRALVLRTFLEGAGFQAIAIGFPARQHAAFDAAEVRWALTWKGRFVDAMTTWEERAMTPAKPLGEDIRRLPTWMPLAQLPSRESAWPMSFGPAAGYEYRGMTVAKDGTPSFHYTVGPLSVTDTFRPVETGGRFRRTLEVNGGSPAAGPWWFRGANDDAQPQAIRFDAQGHATIEEILR